ncbi:type IV pilus modification PilV family protein [Caldimonas tepidiphila]|uniref:type IV pilus modification PilV family protein n=1 Tax=Caldimonas tepidiphila TaxID=2315841 RepID=UPI000E5B8543|nr:hypothetical protein [Caldimonas tepidiphila]
MQRRRPGFQRGVSIIEALAAFLILSMGLLAFARVQSELRFAADLSRQRAEAVQLAQENMEQLRAYSVLPVTAGLRSFGDITAISSASPQSLILDNVNTTFQLNRTVTDAVDASGATSYRQLALRVTWTDRRGNPQEVALNSIIAREDPRDSGNLSVTVPAATARSPLNRDVRIPMDAVNLGGGKSGYAPPGQSFFWVFDSNSAAIVKKCTSANGQALMDNNANNAYVDNTTYCTSRSGYLLKGFIRFDTRLTGGSPSSVNPGRTACDFYDRVYPDSSLRDSANNRTCAHITTPIDALDVTMSNDTGYSPDNVLPKFECYDDFSAAVKANRSYVSYYCAIYVPPRNTDNPNPSWSGRALLALPNSSRSFGSTSDTFRNCRYTADYDSNGRIDQWEHPYSYTDVSYSMTGQNFLVVMGNQACPTGTDTIGNSRLSVDYRTCSQQPAPTNTNLTPAQAVTSCG